MAGVGLMFRIHENGYKENLGEDEMLFEMKKVDKECYENELKDFLPNRIIDIHTHVWLAEHKGKAQSRATSWPARVAKDNSIEDLLETYRLLFPAKEVTPVFFANSVSSDDNLEAQNEYVSQSAKKYNLPALLWSLPEWSRDTLEKQLASGRFLGVKSYLANVPNYIPIDEIRIFDIFPHHQLELLNEKGLILMLHIPRSGRLKDSVNLAEILELDRRYPNVKAIIAHVGRAYCPEDLGNAFEILKETENVMFDISANTCSETFEMLIRTVGAKRILFGSDLPITRMRMKRICENGKYINLVPPKLYGDVSLEPNMKEASPKEAEQFTFFLYEEILAFKKAAQQTNLSRSDVEDIFYNNANNIIEHVGSNARKPQLEMLWPNDKLNNPPAIELPNGYSLRTYKQGDEPEMIELMRKSGFEDWGESQLTSLKNRALPNGMFFIVHDATNKIVATASASHNGTGVIPFSGTLDWVGADPEHRGKGLGYIVCAAVVRRLLEIGYTYISLRTDDFRLAAIKTYIKLGFVPRIFSDDMRTRWKNVYEQLGLKFSIK